MSHQPRWSVVICTSGRSKLLERTLRSLVDAGIGRFPAEIVVVENGGTRHAQLSVESFGQRCRIRYIFVPEAGKAVASNAFIFQHPGVFAWFLDDDVRVTAAAVEAYDLAAKRGCAGMEYYGGPLAIDYEIPPPEWLRPYLPRSARGWQIEPGGKAEQETIFLGANWAAWTDDLIAIGGFDPQLGPGQLPLGDEIALQKRLLRRGMIPVYLDQALVYHWVPSSRCSPQWVLHRAYRIGMTQGLEQPADDEVFLFGYPRWMYRALIERFMRWCLSRLSPNLERRFEAAYNLWFFLGWMKGKQARRYGQSTR